LKYEKDTDTTKATSKDRPTMRKRRGLARQCIPASSRVQMTTMDCTATVMTKAIQAVMK
jgi:hypothetical protein